MKLGEWRKRQLEDVELPSGLTVTLKRALKLVDLASLGSIPTPLVGLVNQAIGGERVVVETVDDFERYGKLTDFVVKAVVVDPPVADAGAGDEEHLGLDELSVDDKVFIFDRVHRASSALAPFRAEPGGNGTVAPGGEGVRAEAEQLAGGA